MTRRTGRTRPAKVFGLGLSRTGTRSLTAALGTLGRDTLHYPTDRAALDTLTRGDARFPHLDHYAGMTDITVVPYFRELDRIWPESKFVLTLRDDASWLRSCRRHWAEHPVDVPATDEKGHVYLQVKRFLRAAVYSSHDFSADRFTMVHRLHVESVTRYFEGREDDLLIMNLGAGDGYEQLAPFLGVPAPHEAFPHVG
ncbi:sulfotransferase family protein [Streptomyces tsukubensis]|uniref:Sulfotransferase family protein n=1 Tax=Streptomyces tsukubensis TaxID=83656 RepID=A0A1V4AGL0_9ACTN|nr:sulfotransferase family protein [Streptomyces tsukubensis]OON82741.1 hypothetical protein B1H18_01495 [Streptomyces tsukubensis]QFR92083.1 hypothetical protein GBW32_02185 [Streptomyces tsukubensis]